MRYQTADEFARDLSRVSKNFSANGMPVATDEVVYTTNNLWKTAFVVLIGIVGLSAAMIYFTQTKQTNPTTQLPTRCQRAARSAAQSGNRNERAGFWRICAIHGGRNDAEFKYERAATDFRTATVSATVTIRGRTGRPPAGAPPQYVAPGGQIYTIPGDGSQFMPPDGSGGYILVPQPPNANANANVSAKPSPTPKATPAAANTQTQTAPTPAEKPQTPAETKPSPTPKTEKPPAKPTEKPLPKPPASSEKQMQSGKEQDS